MNKPPAGSPSDLLGDLLRLQPGERVLWEGRPNTNAYRFRGAWYLIPFSIFWEGFAFFWEYAAITSGAPFPFALFGLPFVGIGLYLLVGRLAVAKREAERAIYRVTDRRIQIASGAWQRSILEMDLRDVPIVQVAQGRNGIGSITFAATPTPFAPPPGWPTLGMYPQPPAFVSIDDVTGVYRIVMNAREALRRGT